MAAVAVLVLWDSDLDIDIKSDARVLWRSFGGETSANTYSLPELVESDANRLKAKYLNWVKDLGYSDSGNGRILDRMEIRPGFSYWWMTLLAEKSYGKSPRIYDAIRLFALEDICKKLSPGKIIINTRDEVLSEVIENWTNSLGIACERHSTIKNTRLNLYSVSWVRVLFEIIKSTGRICKYYLQRSPLRQTNINTISNLADVMVVDYFIHLAKGSVRSGQFRSNYWTRMIDAVTASKLPINWLHHYVEHAEVSSPKTAKKILENFNKKSDALEFHSFIDAGLSWGVWWRVIKDYFNLMKYAWMMRGIRDEFKPSDSHLNLWPLYQNDWINSMVGSTAVWNCFTLNLMEANLASVKPQKLGIYLQENQGWEAALIYVWKAFGHGKLIGVPHATVRYWDLRYYHHPYIFADSKKNKMPRPDFVAVNAPVARGSYMQCDYPCAELVDVEALRYLYLNSMPARNLAGRNTESSDGLRVLILGDIVPEINERVLKSVFEASKMLTREVTFYVRAHPACPINLEQTTEVKFESSDLSLIESLQMCDAVLTGGGTSAAVDAYCSGIRVVQVLAPDQFNMCPLRGLPGVTYVRNALELQQVIDGSARTSFEERAEYFNLNEGLPGWKQILEI